MLVSVQLQILFISHGSLNIITRVTILQSHSIGKYKCIIVFEKSCLVFRRNSIGMKCDVRNSDQSNENMGLT